MRLSKQEKENNASAIETLEWIIYQLERCKAKVDGEVSVHGWQRRDVISGELYDADRIDWVLDLAFETDSDVSE